MNGAGILSAMATGLCVNVIMHARLLHLLAANLLSLHTRGRIFVLHNRCC